MERRLLLTPGPATTSDGVKRAQLVPDVSPREAAFEQVVGRVRRALLRVLGVEDDWTAVPLPGPGTAAVEAALLSLVGPEARILVLENGAYGDRAAHILRLHDVEHRVLRTPWWEPVDPDAVEALLGRDDAFTHLFLVHHETTAGLLNPLEELVGLARRRELVTVVDAMSSFGGMPLADALPGLDVVISSANKCVQGMPGLGFVLCRREVLDAARDVPARSLALDLVHAHDHLEATGQFPFTPPVTVVYALEAALDELLEETVAGRRARYDACYGVLARTVERLGLEYLVEPDHHSRLVTAVREPPDPDFAFGRLRDGLLDRGVTIYPGKVPGQPSFRLGSMGDLAVADMERAMEAFVDALDELGVSRAEEHGRG